MNAPSVETILLERPRGGTLAPTGASPTSAASIAPSPTRLSRKPFVSPKTRTTFSSAPLTKPCVPGRGASDVSG